MKRPKLGSRELSKERKHLKLAKLSSFNLLTYTLKYKYEDVKSEVHSHKTSTYF